MEGEGEREVEVEVKKEEEEGKDSRLLIPYSRVSNDSREIF